MTFIHKCLQGMEAAGLSPASHLQIMADSLIHRYAVKGDKRGKLNGWYICHGNEVFIFGSWRTGEKIAIHPDELFELSPEQRRIRQERIDEALRQLQAEKRRTQEAVAKDVACVWEQSRMTILKHPYLLKKGVAAFGVRQQGNQLVVPMRDAHGRLWSAQYIGPNGRKRFTAGGRVDGLFHLLGHVDDAVYFVEGYSTGATLHQYFGVTVAVAFNAGNLLKAALEFRKVYPNVKIIFAADNDRHTKGNPGLTKARKAAEAVNGRVIWPKFPEGVEGTDYNDLLLSGGFSDG